MMKRTRASVLLGGLLLAGACGAAIAQELRIGLQEDVDVLDPHRARTYVSRLVFTSLCDKLVDIDARLQFVPQLATSWNWSADNKVLTFKLRTDAVFHDGTRFDAAAAKANLDRALTMQDSMRKSELASVQKVDAPDAETLVLTLKAPDATLLANLSDRAGMMLSPKTFADAGSVARAPVCSGPYKFVERIQNDRIVLDKFDKYYDAKDYHFSRLVFLPVPDTTVRLSNLRAGGLQLIERVNPSDVPQIKSDANLKFESVDGLGYVEIYFNVANGERAKTTAFKDARVRRALALSIDRNAINEVIGGGIFTPANQPFPPASPYHSDQPVPQRDVAQAKALLKEAGLTTVKAELSYGNNTTTAAIAEMIQAMAAEAGFQLSLRPTDYAALLSGNLQGNFEASIRGWSGRVDPDGNIYPFVTTKGSLNDGRYSSPEVDRLLDEARQVPDQAKRKVLYDQAEAILDKDVRSTYLYYQPWPFAMTKKLRGFTPYADGMIRLKGVTLEK